MTGQTSIHVTRLRSKYGRASILLNMGAFGGAAGKAGGPMYRLSRSQAQALARQLLDAIGLRHALPDGEHCPPIEHCARIEHIEHIDVSAFGDLVDCDARDAREATQPNLEPGNGS